MLLRLFAKVRLGKLWVGIKSLVDLKLGAIFMNSFVYYVFFFFVEVYTNMYSLSLPRNEDIENLYCDVRNSN